MAPAFFVSPRRVCVMEEELRSVMPILDRVQGQLLDHERRLVNQVRAKLEKLRQTGEQQVKPSEDDKKAQDAALQEATQKGFNS